MLNRILQRCREAARIILKGHVAPFDRVDLGGSIQGAGRIDRPYEQSAFVHAAVRHIALPITAADLKHSRESKKKGMPTEPIQDPRLDELWTSPAKGMASFSEFIIATVGWRKMAGEAFWILGDDAHVPFPAVRTRFPKMILARPDRMKHVTEGGALVGWQYTDGSRRIHALLPTQVVHLKQWNPYDDFRGLGDLAAALTAVETDHANGTFSRTIAQNNGDQGAFVIGKSGAIDESQRKQITALLHEKRRLQQQGIFRPVFLTGDIEIEDAKVRSMDASFLEARRMSASEIYVAFGVPPSFAYQTGAASAGNWPDYNRLILDTCIPEAAEISAAIQRVSSLLLGYPVFAWFSWDSHPVMRESVSGRMGTLDSLWKKGMPLSSIATWLDLDLPAFKGNGNRWIPQTMRPVSEKRESGIRPTHYRKA